MHQQRGSLVSCFSSSILRHRVFFHVHCLRQQASPPVSGEAKDRGHLLVAQLEVKDLSVLVYMRWRHRLRDHHVFLDKEPNLLCFVASSLIVGSFNSEGSPVLVFSPLSRGEQGDCRP